MPLVNREGTRTRANRENAEARGTLFARARGCSWSSAPQTDRRVGAGSLLRSLWKPEPAPASYLRSRAWGAGLRVEPGRDLDERVERDVELAALNGAGAGAVYANARAGQHTPFAERSRHVELHAP